jgi:hypothetical protein
MVIMKEEDKTTKKVLKKPKKAIDKRSPKKRVEFVVIYEVEGSRSKKHKVHAYSREEAEEMMTKRLESQIASGEINGFKILSVEIEN